MTKDICDNLAEKSHEKTVILRQLFDNTVYDKCVDAKKYISLFEKLGIPCCTVYSSVDTGTENVLQQNLEN